MNRSLLALLPILLSAACSPDDTPKPGPGDVASEPVRGPGLGNLTWTAAELFTPIGFVDNDNGVPPAGPEYPITAIKPFGTNTAYMHGGYLVTLFAPDSGFGPGGLLFYDVSDPRSPTLVHRVFDPDEGGLTAELREAHAMGFAHVDGQELVAIHTGTGLQIWSIADPVDAHLVGRLDLPGVNFGDYDDVAWQLFWQGTTVYVAGSGDGLFIVDVTDPAAPVLADRGGLPNPVPTAELGGFRIGPVWAIGNLLVVSSMDNETGYATLDLSDPHHPALLSTRTGLDKFYATCFGGGRVITAMRGAGAWMTIDDVSDPYALRWLGGGPELDEQLYCATQDQFVFQGAEHEVVKIDVSDPAEPVVVGRGELGRHDADHGQVTPFGNLVWVGNDHGSGSGFLPHQLEPDTTPPAVDFVSPPDGAVGQGVRTRVGVSFTDNVVVEEVGPETVQLLDDSGGLVPCRYTVQGNIVNVEPIEPLQAARSYTVLVPDGGLSDWAGNPVADTFQSTFHTVERAPADLDGALSVRLVDPGPVLVGEPVTLRLEVDGADAGEVSWRVGEGVDWVHRTDLSPLQATFDEPGHVSVVASVTDGVRRVSASRLLTVHRPLPVRAPTRSTTLAVDDARGLVWTANHDNDSVSALDAATLDRVFEVPACGGPRAVDVAGDGSVWVSCEDDGVLVVIDGVVGAVERVIPLHPGARPTGLVASPDGLRVVVALEALGELVVFDAATRAELHRGFVGPRPGGVAVSGDGGTVWATRRVSPDDAAEVYEASADLETVRVLRVEADVTTVDGEDRARGVPNMLNTAGLTPDEAELWLPAKQDNVARGLVRDGQPLTHETSVRAVVPRVALATRAERIGRRLDLNDRPPPVDVTFTPLGDYAFLALQGADRIAVHDAYTGQPLAEHRSPADVAVQGLAVSDDGEVLYAHHLLSRSVTAHDLTALRAGTGSDVPVLARGVTVSEEAMDPQVLEGKRIFTRAADLHMSRDGYISCVVCHPDGADDGRTWDFTDRGEGLRNTIDLRGRAGLGHGPLHWTANFDEVQDFENDIRQAFGGLGFLDQADFDAGTRADPLGDPKAGLSEALDALAAYVTSLHTFPTSPYLTNTGELTEAALRGASVFEDLACGDCHAGDAYTDSVEWVRYDVGTLGPDSGQRRGGVLDGLDVPTLRGLHATPPYLHDGSAATVRDVLTTANPEDLHGATSPLTDEAIDDLVAYLLSL